MNYFFYNENSLEGNICNIIFFINIKEFLIKNNINILYYCNSSFIPLLSPLITFKNISFEDISKKTNKAFHLYFDNEKLGFDTISKKIEQSKNKLCFDSYCKYFYNNVMSKHKIFLRIKEFYYIEPELKTIQENLKKNVDILILNSHIPSSFHITQTDIANHFCQFTSSYNILSTSKLHKNIPFMENFSLKNIAAISTKAPIIISFASEILPICLNKMTIANIKQFVSFDQSFISFPNFVQKEKLSDLTLTFFSNFIKPKSISHDVNQKDSELKLKYKNFDWKAYVFFNNDLNFVNEYDSWRHFVSYGINENRVYSFDWEKYVNFFQLESICKNKEQAFLHLIENDSNIDIYLHNLKNNNISLDIINSFDWKFYTNYYEDLNHLKTYEDALQHFVEFGSNENRKISDFDWIDYLFLNKDLLEQGIVTKKKAYNHWLQCGKAEGRSYTIPKKDLNLG